MTSIHLRRVSSLGLQAQADRYLPLDVFKNDLSSMRQEGSQLTSSSSIRMGTLKRANSQPDMSLGREGSSPVYLRRVSPGVELQAQTDRFLPLDVFGNDLSSSSSELVDAIIPSTGSPSIWRERERLPFPGKTNILAQDVMLDPAVLENWQMFYCGGTAAGDKIHVLFLTVLICN